MLHTSMCVKINQIISYFPKKREAERRPNEEKLVDNFKIRFVLQLPLCYRRNFWFPFCSTMNKAYDHIVFSQPTHSIANIIDRNNNKRRI